MSETDVFMPPQPLQTPVLFLIFNRLDTTRHVFEAIRQAKPPRLYIAADGARADKPGEEEIAQAVRNYVVESIDWDCEVKTLFRDNNLGCKYAVSGAISWFFEHEEMGIILEDDCIPNISFFLFCQELLEKYKDDDRIAMISGNNFQFGRRFDENSYYFSRYTHIWGWASWRRAWKNYDLNMTLWPEIRSNQLLQIYLTNRSSYRYWEYIFDKCYKNEILTWDYQWLLMSWIQNQLTILPCKNLVTNVGFGPEAVHTKRNNEFSNMKTEEIVFPLIHPEYVLSNFAADLHTEKNNFSGGNAFIKLARAMKRWISSIVFK